MDFKKLLITLLIIFPVLNSCSVDDFNDTISLEELITSYDLWYVDLNRTQGEPDVPFLLKAFTISFNNGRLYANNNLVEIGSLGNGLGLTYGYYNTRNGYLEIDEMSNSNMVFVLRMLDNSTAKILSTDYEIVFVVFYNIHGDNAYTTNYISNH